MWPYVKSTYTQHWIALGLVWHIMKQLTFCGPMHLGISTNRYLIFSIISSWALIHGHQHPEFYCKNVHLCWIERCVASYWKWYIELPIYPRVTCHEWQTNLAITFVQRLSPRILSLKLDPRALRKYLHERRASHDNNATNYFHRFLWL